jgi:hypothetical protein
MPFVSLLWAEWLVHLAALARAAFSSGRPALARPAVAAGLCLVAVVGPAQFAGNLAYLWKNRHANYPDVCRRLDSLIPPGSTVYGGMAFWTGLRHHVFVPYTRMSWDHAVSEYHPDVVILDDWVMVNGSEPGQWDELRADLHDYAERHGKLLGTVPNRFYGDLKVYRVRHPRREERLGRR